PLTRGAAGRAPPGPRLLRAGSSLRSRAANLLGMRAGKADAATRGIKVSDADAAELTGRFATMPPHPEVPAALRRLRDHGFRLFTLTDNTLEISGRQLERAGVIDLFERRFSVD